MENVCRPVLVLWSIRSMSEIGFYLHKVKVKKCMWAREYLFWPIARERCDENSDMMRNFEVDYALTHNNDYLTCNVDFLTMDKSSITTWLTLSQQDADGNFKKARSLLRDLNVKLHGHWAMPHAIVSHLWLLREKFLGHNTTKQPILYTRIKVTYSYRACIGNGRENFYEEMGT